MHVDFDYFFAQVEERENPKIENKAVVVCVYSGRGNDAGAVSTANYKARQYGVKSGIPIAFAKSRLKDVEAVFLPVNHRLYDEVSDNIMNILRKYADEFEQVGVDEAFLDITANVDEDLEKAKKLAVVIKEEILRKEKITCSIGIGPNKLVAKIAAGRQKPNGLTVVSPADVRGFLAPLSVREIVGIGRKTEGQLKNLGIQTIGQLAAFNLDQLINTFGKNLGMYFHDAAFGIDESPVKQRDQAESISRIVTLKENTRDLALMNKEIDELAEDIHSRIMEQGLSFKSVSITVIMEDLAIVSRSKTFQSPIEGLETLKKTAKDLLEQLLKEETEHLVRRIGVKISNFIMEKGQTKLSDF